MRLQQLFESWGPEQRPGVLPIGDYLSPDSEFVDPAGKKDPIELHQEVDDILNAGGEPRVVRIKPSQVYATQDWLSNGGGDGPLYPEYEDLPVVYQKGRYPSYAWYVLDGHHRITAALKKHQPIDVYMFGDYQLDQLKSQKSLKEVNDPGHLTVPDELLMQFLNRGWQIAGEGRDQVALTKPGTRYVLKIVGQGSDTRIDMVRQYVDFYRKHQRNPHFPRVGGDRTLRWEGKTYYAYTQELLSNLPGDEAVLDYLEYAMTEMAHGEEPNFNKIPPGLSVEQIEGLMYAVDELFGAGLGDIHSFDLANVYNIMQRNNGQLVIVDPFAGWEDDEELSESEDPGNRRTAELLVRELEVELADYYDASRGTSPAQYKDQVRRRIGALNQELQGLGFKYAPTAPGKIAPLGSRFVENFADGKVKGKSRPGRVKRAGASCKGSVTDLRAKARKYGGERGKMYHWCANMKGGKKK